MPDIIVALVARALLECSSIFAVCLPRIKTLRIGVFRCRALLNPLSFCIRVPIRAVSLLTGQLSVIFG